MHCIPSVFVHPIATQFYTVLSLYLPASCYTAQDPESIIYRLSQHALDHPNPLFLQLLTEGVAYFLSVRNQHARFRNDAVED